MIATEIITSMRLKPCCATSPFAEDVSPAVGDSPRRTLSTFFHDPTTGKYSAAPSGTERASLRAGFGHRIDESVDGVLSGTGDRISLAVRRDTLYRVIRSVLNLHTWISRAKRIVVRAAIRITLLNPKLCVAQGARHVCDVPSSDIIDVIRDRNGRNNADDRDNDHQFDQRKPTHFVHLAIRSIHGLNLSPFRVSE